MEEPSSNVTLLVANSTPIVGVVDFGRPPLTYLCKSNVFPVPVSPISTTIRWLLINLENYFLLLNTVATNPRLLRLWFAWLILLRLILKIKLNFI